eukprot:scaffold469_cov391-Prasinococcus_capsulatus_cf.AAC.4
MEESYTPLALAYIISYHDAPTPCTVMLTGATCGAAGTYLAIKLLGTTLKARQGNSQKKVDYLPKEFPPIDIMTKGLGYGGMVVVVIWLTFLVHLNPAILHTLMTMLRACTGGGPSKDRSGPDTTHLCKGHPSPKRYLFDDIG